MLAAGTAWGEWGADEISRAAYGGKALGFEALLPDYAVKGFPNVAGYALSAIAGAAILIIAFKLLSLLKKNGRQESKA